MELNEIIALSIVLLGAVLIVIYESILNRIAAKKIRELRESASAWKTLYKTVQEERDILMRRVESKDCQKVLSIQMKLDDAMEEIDRLQKLNETYKKQIETNKKKKRQEATV